MYVQYLFLGSGLLYGHLNFYFYFKRVQRDFKVYYGRFNKKNYR